MSPRFSSLAPLLALSALLVGLSTGCGEGPGPNPPPTPSPDAARSTVEVSRTQDVVADGEDSAAVTVTVRAADGAVLAGRQVRLEVSGEGATVTPAQGLTDGGGVLRAALKATAPGVKTVTASVQETGGVVVLASRPGVGFVRPPSQAAQLAFTSTSLSATAGSPLRPVLEVAVQDASGVTVPGASPEVTLALGSHPAGAVLSGTLTVRAVNGVARFTEVVLTQVGTGYTLVASAQGLAGATSAAFNVVPGPAARLAFTQQPAGQSVRRALTPVRVGLVDAFGNTVRAGTPLVTVALQGGAATLGGTVALEAVAGVASFTTLTVDAEGTGYRLVASAQGLEGATSDAFSITDDVAPAVPVLRAGVATTRTVDVEWNAVGDDGLLGTATAYELRYSTSPIVTDGDFAAATAVPTGAPQAPGTVERVTLSGLAQNTSYSVALRVTDSAGNAVRSSSLSVSTQAPSTTQLVFTQQPVDGTAGEALADIRVALRDADGNVVTSSTQAVTLTLAQDASITRTVNAVGGVATFSGLRINTAGAGYSFRALSGVLSASSTTFAIRPGVIQRLDLVGLAAPVVAGVQGTVEVIAYDAHGNVSTGYAGVIRLTSSDAAAVLPPDTTFTEADQGRKTLRVTLRTAGRQSVTVTDGDRTDSLEVDVAAAAPARLAFTRQPQNGRTRIGLDEVQVSLLDAFGNVSPVASPAVTLTLAGNGAATLGGTRMRAPVNGVASFADLSVDEEGTGYTLSASADGLTGATSTAFNIVDDVPPARPVLAAGRVERRSILVTWSAVGDDGEQGTAAEYELRYATTPITSDADFEQATRVPTGAPRAPGLHEEAELTGLTPATSYYVALRVRDNAGNVTRSATLEVTTATPQVVGLAFTQQPVDGIAGEALADIRVALVDADGQTVTTATSAVTLALAQDASFTRTVDAAGGVATFSGLRITAAGADYTFQASSGSLPAVISAAFAIRPAAAARLALLGPPAPVTAGTASGFTVTAYDAFDNVATGYTGTVRFSSTDPQALVPADVTFTGADRGQASRQVTLRTQGEQRVSVVDVGQAALTAEAGVTVVPGPAAGFVMTAPDTTAAGAGARVSITALDAFGNVATGYTGTIRFSSTDGAASLPADFTFLPANGGREQFDVILRTAGSREVQVEDISDPALVAMRTLQVTPGPADSLSLRAEAGPHPAGAAFSIEAVALDAFGNVATGYEELVDFDSSDPRATVPAAYTFTPADAGRRVFTDVVLRTAGTQSITVSDFNGRESTLVLEVEPGAAVRMELVGDSSTSVAGEPLGLALTLRDDFGNVATGYTGTVHFTSTDGAASLPADHTFTAADLGQRRFQATLVRAGTVWLTATDTVDATIAGSAQQTVEPGAPAGLAFIEPPMDGDVRMPLPALRVELQDAYGNLTRANSPPVEVALSGDTPGATLGGTLVVFPVEGVASFQDLTVSQEGFYTFTATASGLTPATSASFHVDDFVPPAEPVLSASDVQATRLTLSWTAVGDDGLEDTAALYDLRYSTQPILTESDWEGALRGPDLTPLPPGSSMSATLTGLLPSTRYYFGLEVMDGAGNTARALLDTTTAAPSNPCDTVVCEPPAATCSADGRSVVTYTSACREVDGAGVCENTPASTRCVGDTACSDGVCTPITPEQQAGNVVISELHVLGDSEVIELHNPTGADVDLRGFTFETSAGTVLPLRAVTDLDGTAGASVVLSAGGYLQGVVNPADGVVPAGAGFVFGPPGTSSALLDTGDLLVLSAADNVIEDFVDFRGFVTDPNQPLTDSSFVGFAGSTTQLGSASLDAESNDDPRSWCVSFYPATGTKTRVNDTLGAANGSCDVAVINEVLLDHAQSDDATSFIEIAGPGGAVVGGVQITDIVGEGSNAGDLNADNDRDPEETDGIFVIPAGTRIPADGILLIADIEPANRTTAVANFVSGVDVLARDVDFEHGTARDAIQLIRGTTLLDAVGWDSQGDSLDTNTAYNGLAMYETGTALYPPVHATLARLTSSLDTDDNRADFHGDPTPTPGLPNDEVNVTITRMTPNNGLASTTTAGFVVTGTDIPLGTGLRFGTNTTVVDCTTSLDGTGMTCIAPSNNGVPAVVDVTVLLSRSVRATDIVMPGAFTYTGVRNETDTADEADYCNFQYPSTLTATSGESTDTFYTQIYEAGLTDSFGGQAPGIISEAGFGPLNSNPTTDSSWRFFPLGFNVEAGNNDEYMGSFLAPMVTTPQQYSYTSRFSFDNGLNWTYCDLNGAGSGWGLAFESTQLGVMTVNP